MAGRDESEEERLDRKFDDLDDFQVTTYLVLVVLAAALVVGLLVVLPGRLDGVGERR